MCSIQLWASLMCGRALPVVLFTPTCSSLIKQTNNGVTASRPPLVRRRTGYSISHVHVHVHGKITCRLPTEIPGQQVSDEFAHFALAEPP